MNLFGWAVPPSDVRKRAHYFVEVTELGGLTQCNLFFVDVPRDELDQNPAHGAPQDCCSCIHILEGTQAPRSDTPRDPRRRRNVWKGKK